MLQNKLYDMIICFNCFNAKTSNNNVSFDSIRKIDFWALVSFEVWTELDGDRGEIHQFKGHRLKATSGGPVGTTRQLVNSNLKIFSLFCDTVLLLIL